MRKKREKDEYEVPSIEAITDVELSSNKPAPAINEAKVICAKKSKVK